jgi:anti-sigma B factor antagonist/stage II sporulation protein AA (anti-sigma F factor antagonist)
VDTGFTLDICDSGGVVRVTVAGEVDLSSSRVFEAELSQCVDRACPVELDLSALHFMDSTGLRAVIELQNRARDLGADLRVIALSPFIARVVTVAGLDDRLLA